MRKFFILMFCSLLELCVLGQGKEFFQLEYKDKPNFKEFNNFLKDTVWRFNQTVAFDIPNYIDEESWTRLVVEIRDTSAFLRSQVFSFQNDKLTKYEFASWSVWSAIIPPDSTSITGSIELVTSTNDEIALKLDIEVINTVTNNRYYYKGERVFKKTKSNYEFYRR